MLQSWRGGSVLDFKCFAGSSGLRTFYVWSQLQNPRGLTPSATCFTRIITKNGGGGMLRTYILEWAPLGSLFYTTGLLYFGNDFLG